MLFGQRRIGPEFSTDDGVPSYLSGRLISDVAADLRSGVLTADQLPINAFTGANGELITINNRTLGALSEAGLQPTRINCYRLFCERIFDQIAIVKKQASCPRSYRNS